MWCPSSTDPLGQFSTGCRELASRSPIFVRWVRDNAETRRGPRSFQDGRPHHAVRPRPLWPTAEPP